MMRSLFLVAAIVFVVVKAQLLTKEEIEKLRAMHESCMKQSSVDKSLVAKAMKGEYVDDQKLKDHIFCANKALGFQNDAGDIDDEALVKKLTEKFQEENIVKAAVKQCSLKKETAPETGYQLLKCLHSFAPKDLDILSMF